MPASETPDVDPQGPPAGKSLSKGSGAATESGKGAYNHGSGGDKGGGEAALDRKRKDELPKSVLDD